MDKSTVFSKTAKGMSEAMSGGKSLAREHARILGLVNGKSSIGDLIASGALAEGKYAATFDGLLGHGLIRVYEGARSLEAIEFTRASDDDFPDTPPAIVVEELSPQESVQIWAQARRGATELASTGFYSYGGKSGGLSAATGIASRTALVIEDDEELAELLVVLLSEKGMVVQVAADIPAAMALVKAGPVPAVVLLDIVLPGAAGKDGFDLLAYIRRTEGWTRVPVVMVTSEVSDTQVMKGLKLGADGYMFKPFKWEALYSCIREVAGI